MHKLDYVGRSNGWTDRLKGSAGDMKSDVVMVEIVLILHFIFMFLKLDMVLYSLEYFTFDLSHYLD